MCWYGQLFFSQVGVLCYETTPRTLINSDFCSVVSLDGYLTSNLILKLPFFPGSFEIGIPSFARTISSPGLTISVIGIMRVLPSREVSSRVLPVSDSSSVISWFTTRSFPSLRYIACSFSSTTNIRSAGMMPGSWFPFWGKVIFVPFFQPGFISIVNISSTVRNLLQKNWSTSHQI